MARPKPLAELIESCLSPALAKQGFSGADIIASWPEIVGERLAAWSQPMRVDWRRRGPDGTAPDPATLVVRVESAFAIELQHLAPLVIERINAFYGWACIGRIVLKQGPVRRSRVSAPEAPAPDPEALAKVARTVASIPEAELREALERLGTAVAAATEPDRHRQHDPPVP